MDAQAYLLRHREHVRALIFNGAIDPLLGPAQSCEIGASNANAIASDVATVCRRFPCQSAGKAFAALDRWLRRHPVSGTTRYVTGAPHRVHIDERELVRIAGNTDPTVENDGELVPAAAALRRRDTAPLMRIAAHNTSPLFGDSGDPAIGSTGRNAATQCTDLAVPWDLSAPFARRRAQFEAAIHRISFGPFSPDALANKAGFSDYCLRWPAPRHVIPVVAPRTRFPDFPCADHRRDARHVDDARAESIRGAPFPAGAARGSCRTAGIHPVCSPIASRTFTPASSAP